MPEMPFPDDEITTNIHASYTDPSTIQPPEDALLDEELLDFDEELIIEDFTIDGICGVY